jgi:peptidoglycan glycosyltransferase
MAMVAGAVANGGVVVTPHVGARVEDQDGQVLRTVSGKPWRTAMPPQTAATIAGFMTEVVQRGTGTNGRIAGITVAGKTGTAQTCQGCHPHAWFVAFAPAEAPRYAVAVIVENGGSLSSEATGGKVAAPIAAQLLRFVLTR